MDARLNRPLEPEAQLVQQCLRGDGAAWEELVRRHSRRIFNLCYRFTNQRQEAEDLSQEVFMRVYKTLGSYRDIYGAFGTWVTSVTRNLLIDHYRRTRRDRLTDSMEDVMTQVESKESAGRRPDHSGGGHRAGRAFANSAGETFTGFARSCYSCETWKGWTTAKFGRCWKCRKAR